MPVFAYEGRGATGEVKKGSIEAADLEAARARLRLMKIQPTTVTQKKGLAALSFGGGSINIGFLKPKVKTKDLVIFTRQFATMIDSGLPLVQCLDIQSKQAGNPALREQLTEVKAAVEAGTTFADALKKYPDTFDPLFRNLVAAGEIGGILDTILNRLATFLEKNEKLKRKVKGAMTYPLIVFSVAILVTAVLLLKVVPTFEQMFMEFGSSLPAPTQFVVDLSYFLRDSWYFFLAGIFIAIFAAPFCNQPGFSNSSGLVAWSSGEGVKTFLREGLSTLANSEYKSTNCLWNPNMSSRIASTGRRGLPSPSESSSL